MTARRARWALVGVLVGAVTCSDPTAPLGLVASAGRLIAGETVACAFVVNGDVHCWGGNSVYWEYGRSPSEVPGGVLPSVASVPKFTRFATGVAQHMCGISALGEAQCWGRGTYGQLGSGILGADGNAPVFVGGSTLWKEVSVSRLTTCGVSTTGDGYCWGANQGGEVGSSAVALSTRSPTPVLVEGGHVFSSIAAGWVHACGIVTNGDAWCWGSNTSGQLGIGTIDSLVRYRSPLLVTGGLKFRQLSLGSRHSCGLSTDSLAYCWGENATGQLGDNSTSRQSVPTPVAGGLKFIQLVTSSGFGAGAVVVSPVAAGFAGHTCGLATDNSAYCWGWNASGELGDGTSTNRLVPTAVSNAIKFTSLAVGGAYSCGMNGDKVWCWGSNLFGQVGHGDFVQSWTTPKSVGPPFR
jgi:alpha-tubulin suppressor-like RCC1 family protein